MTKVATDSQECLSYSVWLLLSEIPTLWHATLHTLQINQTLQQFCCLVYISNKVVNDSTLTLGIVYTIFSLFQKVRSSRDLSTYEICIPSHSGLWIPCGAAPRLRPSLSEWWCQLPPSRSRLFEGGWFQTSILWHSEHLPFLWRFILFYFSTF